MLSIIIIKKKKLKKLFIENSMQCLQVIALDYEF